MQRIGERATSLFRSRTLRDFARDRKGTTAVEYAILITMLSTFVLSISGVGGNIVTNFYEVLTQKVADATSNSAGSS
ncbi:Flp pilus assembly protein, pilin Flp [Hartmannibacter diazotrophicus]|uniref:Flp pilus assembly protein, pilin Flp n=1 Tax=Hartmannibacter diazotrophicus TaxID=1482074 RepID=A0A2C9DAS5_9HYPH|nr:hypothetical protein [Hartmannibacter diazotrophicus]SON57343.1 Flp pilus assembly protein, pilin Flp [Hartmannibacter diazotrophicus]